MNDKLRFSGTVLGVRTFQDVVFLFVRCELPKKVFGRTIKFKLNEGNCDNPVMAAGCFYGDKVVIDRVSLPDPQRKYRYDVDIAKGAISADVVNEWEI